MFSRVSIRAIKLLKSSYASVTLNRITLGFVGFSIIYCFAQGIIQASLFSIDSAKLDLISWIVQEGGIPADSQNLTYLDGGGVAQLRLHMCNDVPFLRPSPCFEIFESEADDTPSCSQAPTQDLAIVNWDGRINVTSVTANATLILNVDPPIQLNHRCIQILTFPQQILNDFRREDITFVFLQFWLLIISLFAVTRASIPHILTVLVTRVLNTAWSAYAVWRTRYFEDVFLELVSGPSSPCCIASIFSGYFHNRAMFEIADLAFNCTGLAVGSYLSWVLLRTHSSQRLKYLGAPKHIERINKFFMAVLACLQLEAFVLVAALGLWIDVLFNTAIRHISDHTNFYIYVGAIVLTMILLVPWISMGWYAIRREMRKTTVLFLSISLAFIVGWAIMFYSQVYRWTFLQWPYLGCFTVASFILLIATMSLGLICRMNFGKGLAEYLRAEAALSSSSFSPDIFDDKLQGNSSFDIETKTLSDLELLPVQYVRPDLPTEELRPDLLTKRAISPVITYKVPYGQPF